MAGVYAFPVLEELSCCTVSFLFAETISVICLNKYW